VRWEGLLGASWAHIGGHIPQDVDGLLCELLGCGIREVEGTLSSLTGRDECAIDEREDVLAPGEAPRGLGRVLEGRPYLLECLECWEWCNERRWVGVFWRGDGTDRRGAGWL